MLSPGRGRMCSGREYAVPGQAKHHLRAVSLAASLGSRASRGRVARCSATTVSHPPVVSDADEDPGPPLIAHRSGH
ncbi:hypothetical protein PybrP1_012414 [[Pythium] brassicae (nom. inval.)]|nr:hypothetical protein PybrP1_012414 [[Pythium] brassicae (nom. inval.)]